MPAKTKSELLAVCAKEYAKLADLIVGIDPAFAMEKRADDTSIKDVIAHRAHWIDLFLGWYADGQAGHEVAFPAKGYKWNDLKRYNADLRAAQAGIDWPAAAKMLEDRAGKLTALIESLSEDQLYDAPMKGARNDWTTGRWAEAAGPSHYRSASKYLRAELRKAAAAA